MTIEQHWTRMMI